MKNLYFFFEIILWIIYNLCLKKTVTAEILVYDGHAMEMQETNDGFRNSIPCRPRLHRICHRQLPWPKPKREPKPKSEPKPKREPKPKKDTTKPTREAGLLNHHKNITNVRHTV
ncbi:histone H1E-like isoform X1 [Homalodisca vitripennis]|uniref:histone H1E-like isoform X1 n=1 Tax=Homalodisca vitripennis TaxID=197043 RepID=UPI001EEC7DC6|nr:histone H1E-like isoform X1 [Homalodisca vitripennis]